MKNLVLAVIASLTISACATPYQTSGFRGGVQATQLNERLFQVKAGGNAYTSKSRVQEFVLLKASEVAINNGYDAFGIVSAEDMSRQYSYTQPGQATSSTTGHIHQTGAFSTLQANTTTTYTPPKTTTTVKPGQSIKVYLLTADEARQYVDVYNARLIYRQIAPKYVKTEEMLLPL